MAKRTDNAAVIKQLIRLGPAKAIVILIAAAVFYFFNGGEIPHLTNNTDTVTHDTGNQDFVAATIVRAVDGDTAVVKVDGQERRVRFLGVDTPETVHPNKPVQFFGKEASRFTKDSLNGRRVWLEYDSSPQDRYGRHLVYIWLTNPKTVDEASMREYMFNAKLLLGGYAKVMIIKPNKRYEKKFRKFQDEAKNKRLGVWSQ